jgi:hypothetical protein
MQFNIVGRQRRAFRVPIRIFEQLSCARCVDSGRAQAGQEPAQQDTDEAPKDTV